MQVDAKDMLMARFLPNVSTDQGMPLAIATPQTNPVLDVECHAIAPTTQQDLSPMFGQLLQKMDGQTAFVQQGFEHLIKQNQSFDHRLSQLERQSAQPVYQQPVQPLHNAGIYQPPDIPSHVVQHLAVQQHGMMQLMQNQNQTNLAVMQMTHALQKIADRPAVPTTINHYVDQSQHTDNHSVEIHGDNYGAICTDGIQKNGGGFFFFLFAMITSIIIGTSIYGK